MIRHALLVSVLALAACSRAEPINTPQLQNVRTYGWEATVVDPEPDWHPTLHRLVVRTRGGFAVLEEGRRAGANAWSSDERREAHYPVWLNGDQFVFGPPRNVSRTDDGRVVPASDGLTVVTLDAKGAQPQRRQLCDRGFRPRPGAEDTVWAQWGNQIVRVDRTGASTVFGEGFDPLPQRQGPGLCFRETPVFDTDWWTGKPALGDLFIRWQAGVVDRVPGGVQAAWTRRGQLLVTTIAALPAAPAAWHQGSRIALVAGPGAAPVVLAENARDPAPNPVYDLYAYTDNDGGVRMGPLTAGAGTRIAERGSRPRWSHDGLRLLVEEPPAPGRQEPYLRVHVFVPPP